jgi:membrane protease subunit HflK
VDVYDTGKIRETVVGYDSDRKTDILWSESHGGTEYKLLLGEGNELVSVNIRLQYKIDDLYEYVTASANAEKILNARAYSVVTDMTIGTTLDVIISEDRDELAVMIENALAEYLDSVNIGIAVVDVVIESIHPPVEVAAIYQKAISAEVEAQAEKSKAEGMAEATLSYAKMNRNSAIKIAEADQYERVGSARAEISEFTAMVEANNAYPDAFKYYKYLETLTKVFSKQRLYILGEDIDEKYIYFGADVVIYK